MAIDDGWIGLRVTEFETVTGARVAFLTRFGKGMLPTGSSVIQDGDLVHVLVTDDIAESVVEAAGKVPEGSH